MTKSNVLDLRSRAKAKIAQRLQKPAGALSTELEIHRVELEIQNEELLAARSQAEASLARYTGVFDFAPIGYALLGASGEIREINHAGAALLGAERARLVGKLPAAYVARSGLVAFDALLNQVRTSSRSTRAELELLRNHQPWLAQITGAVLPRSEATLLIAFDDVTEARRKDLFLAMLSHELREPLAPILSGLSALRMIEPESGPAIRMLDRIERSANHLTRMVDDLLDVTRITRGKLELQREPVELVGLVSVALADARPAFERRNLQIELRLPGGALWTLGDPVRFTQILSNLLSNAQKFTPDGGRVTVSLDRVEGRAVIRVRDTGIGVEPSQIPALFEPFVQAAQSFDRSRGGLGLGLTVARRLLELHGGHITMRSEGPGRGTEVAFDLPIEGANQLGQSSAATVSDVPRRVLIIEDHADAAVTLKALLAIKGHEVRIASDGADGLALARAFDPDIVLCDLGLPGMDGFAVARAIRADPALRDRRLVAISGHAQPEDVAQARGAGFDSHLAKPVKVAILEAELALASR